MMASEPRAPGATRTRRSEETKELEELWKRNRVASVDRNRAADKLNEGYRFIQAIHAALGPDYDILAEALFVLQVLELHEQDWHRRLEQHARNGGGSVQDNFAFAMMQHVIERKGINNVKRAAELSVAEMGLYPDAASFHSAVTRCRNVWQRYKAGSFRPRGTVVDEGGILVRPRRDKLRHSEVRRILDPSDLKYVPRKGKRVADTLYWRRLVKLGFVEIVQDD